MQYAGRLLLATLAALLVVGGTNYAVDPYGAFSTAIDERPQSRALFDANVRLVKPHVVSRLRPQAVILGSSRAEVGLSPAHPGWQYERVYNLALPHASIREIFEYLEHAIATGELEQAVLGLDFFQFNPLLEPRRDFKECRLRDPGSVWSTVRASVCDLPFLLLSRRAFVESIRRLVPGDSEATYLRDGSRSPHAKESEIVRAGSQHGAFLLTAYRYYNRTDLLRGYLESDVDFERSTGPYFEALLRACHARGIDLRLLISPSHAQHGELMEQMGLWDEFVRWKRYLLDTTRSIAAEFDAPPYAIWDFADYNANTGEPLPSLEVEDARMKWYWESSHYTRAFGDLILNQVLAGSEDGVGKLLDPDSFDSWIRGIEARKAWYRNAAASELSLMLAHMQRRYRHDRNHAHDRRDVGEDAPASRVPRGPAGLRAYQN